MNYQRHKNTVALLQKEFEARVAEADKEIPVLEESLKVIPPEFSFHDQIQDHINVLVDRRNYARHYLRLIAGNAEAESQQVVGWTRPGEKIQYTGANDSEVNEFTEGLMATVTTIPVEANADSEVYLEIETPQGTVTARPGDWIVKDRKKGLTVIHQGGEPEVNRITIELPSPEEPSSGGADG